MITRLALVASLYLFLFFSGFAGLGYQMAWTRMLSVGLGHEIVAVLAVVAAFFAGVALGAWVLDRPIGRSRHPGRWYAGLEAAIGFWSLVLVVLIPVANEVAARLIGVEPSAWRHWGVAFLLPFVVLLPATASMGATLPAMERLVFRLRQGGHAVGGLYAANTFGAVAGTVATTLWLAPAFGFTGSLLILAAVNAVCALGTLVVSAGQGVGHVAPAAAAATTVGVTGSGTGKGEKGQELGRLSLILLATGFLGIGYEMLIVRMLSQILENTIYSFAAVLSVWLLGTALGAAVYQLFRPRRRFETPLAVLLILLAASCLGGTALLWFARSAYEGARSLAALDLAGGISAELAVAALILIAPTMVMGATFSHLAQRVRDVSDRLGHAVAVNTLGASVAPLVFGVGLLPALGSKLALAGVSLGYLALLPLASVKRWGLRCWVAIGGVAAAAAAILLGPMDFRFVEVPAGGALLSHQEGVMAAVSVVTDQRGARHLKVNDEFRMGGTASVYSDRRQADVPLLLHPHPQRALFLGLGTGATLAGVLDHPDLSAEGVELVPEVIGAMPYFDSVLDGLRSDARVRIIAADARRYVRATDQHYDVIVADVFHPSRDGAGALYTAEHFAAVRDRLGPGGLFCQWLPLYQLDAPTLQTIIRTFLTVFPDATAHLAHYSLLTPMLCLVGSAEPRHYPPDWLATRASDPRLAAALARLDLDSPFALFGTFVAGPVDLGQFAGDGPINTDDRPVVTFTAPRAVYGTLSPTWGRLKAIIQASTPQPKELLTEPDGEGSGFDQRLAAYWRARNAFLATGTTVEPSADPRVMARQIAGPLLAIVRLSPDFEPAYRPLLALARALSQDDPDTAHRLLADLDQANPGRDDARQLSAQLFPDKPLPTRDAGTAAPEVGPRAKGATTDGASAGTGR